jgi:hypothetical protein
MVKMTQDQSLLLEAQIQAVAAAALALKVLARQGQVVPA